MNVTGGISWFMIRTSLVVLTLITGCVEVSAQERAQPIRNQELWASAGVKARLPGFFKDVFGNDTYKKFKLAGDVDYRSADVFYAWDQVFTDLSLSYKISRHFDLSAVHRISFRPEDNTRNRSSLQLEYDTKWHRFNFQYRASYQHSYLEFANVREVIRNKFIVEYDIPKFKLDPEISTEFFTWVGYQGVKHIGTRYSIGTSYSPSKTQEIGLKVMHDREHGVAWPKYSWIYSLSYTLNLREL